MTTATAEALGGEEHFRLLFQNSPVGMALVGTDGSWIDVNPAVCAITGYEREELLTGDFQSITHPEDLDTDLDLVRRLLADEIDGYQLPKRYLRPDGSPVSVLLNVSLVRDAADAPLYFVVQIVDTDQQRRTEAALAAKDRLFRLTFEASPIGMAVGRPDGVLIEANQALADLLGHPVAALVGRHHDEFVHPEDRGPHATATFETRYLHADGSTIWAQVTMSSAQDESGDVVQLIHVEDISIRHQRQAAQLREQRGLRSLVDLQAEIVAQRDEASTLEAVVSHTLAFIGNADGAVVELPERGEDGELRLRYVAVAGALTTQQDLTVAADASLTGQAFSTATLMRTDDTQSDVRVDAEACRRTGIRSMLIAPLLAGSDPIGVLKVSSRRPHAFDDDDEQSLTLLANSLTGALQHIRDRDAIRTALAKAETAIGALSVSEERFRLAFERSPLGMIVLEVDGERVLAARTNEPVRQMTGLEAADLESEGHDALLARVENPEVLQRRLAELWSGSSDHLTESIVVRSGDEAPVELRLHGALDRDAAGKPRSVIMIVEDVTAQREVEARLAERAQLLELASDAIIVRDMDDTVRYWNPAAERLYLWPAQAVIGRNLDRLLATTWVGGTDRQQARAQLLADGHWQGEVEHHRSDGRRVVVFSRKTVQRDEHGDPVGILTINSDITARREAETALEASEELFRSQFQNSAVGQCIRGLNDVLESVNPALATMLGYDSPEELQGRTGSSLTQSETLAQRSTAFASIFAGETDSVSYETTLRRRDGTSLEVHFTSSALRDAAGRPAKFVSIFEDISERKRAERARDQALAALQLRHEELEQTERLKTDLIGMLGHEINTPVTVIAGATELVEDTWGADASVEQREFIALLRRNTERLQRTVTEVLGLVTVEGGTLTATPEPVDVLPRIQAVLDTFGISTQITGDAGTFALVQPEHLDHIVANLVSNALKYADGPREISFGHRDDVVEVRVVDHGDGVPLEFRDVLFDRFTRDEDATIRAAGTGLGLYIVRELARANGGDVGFSETPGGGATFTLTLPADPGAVQV